MRMPWWRNLQKKREIPFYALQKYISTLCRNTVLLVGDMYTRCRNIFQAVALLCAKVELQKTFLCSNSTNANALNKQSLILRPIKERPSSCKGIAWGQFNDPGNKHLLFQLLTSTLFAMLGMKNIRRGKSGRNKFP